MQLIEVNGRPIREITSYLAVGDATLNRWIKDFRDQDLLGARHEDASK